MTQATRKDTSRTGLTVREFLDQEAKRDGGHSLASLAEASGIPYSTLHRHVVLNRPLSVENAKRLQEWSDKRISAAKTLGLES